MDFKCFLKFFFDPFSPFFGKLDIGLLLVGMIRVCIAVTLPPRCAV